MWLPGLGTDCDCDRAEEPGLLLSTYTVKICPGLHLLALGQTDRHQDHHHRRHPHQPRPQHSGPPTHLCFHLKGNFLDKGVNIRGLTSRVRIIINLARNHRQTICCDDEARRVKSFDDLFLVRNTVKCHIVSIKYGVYSWRVNIIIITLTIIIAMGNIQIDINKQ